MPAFCTFLYTRNCDILDRIPVDQWEHILAIGEESTWPDLKRDFNREGPGLECPHARYFRNYHYPNGPHLFAVDINRNVYYHRQGKWTRYKTARNVILIEHNTNHDGNNNSDGGINTEIRSDSGNSDEAPEQQTALGTSSQNVYTTEDNINALIVFYYCLLLIHAGQKHQCLLREQLKRNFFDS